MSPEDAVYLAQALNESGFRVGCSVTGWVVWRGKQTVAEVASLHEVATWFRRWVANRPGPGDEEDE